MSTQRTEEQQRAERMITESATQHGLVPVEWDIDEYGSLRAFFGRWQVVTEDEDRGLYESDIGVLHASVVGAPQHNNEAVAFYFVNVDFDPDSGGERVVPFEDIQPKE